MGVIDERGRLFGRVNVIDAAAAALALLLVPLAFGAYVLFRTPTPEVASLEPAAVTKGGPRRVKVRGEHLRPFLRVRLGTVEVPAFLVQSSRLAELELPDLDPGTYDLVLYNEAQEVARRPAALTVLAPAAPPSPPPSPTIAMQLVGRFDRLTRAQTATITVGTRFSDDLAEKSASVAEVLAVRPPEPALQRVKIGSSIMTAPIPDQVQVPALLRVQCVVENASCKFGSSVVERDTTITVRNGRQVLAFWVEEIRPATTPVAFRTAVAEVLARFVVKPEVFDRIKTGDSDLISQTDGPGVAARLIDIRGRQNVSSRVAVDLAPFEPEMRHRVFHELEQPVSIFEATVRVPIIETPGGWQYKGQRIKIGAEFTFETSLYTLRGWILRVTLPGQTREHAALATR